MRMAVNQRPAPSWARRPELRVGAVIAVAVAVAIVVWLVVRSGDSKSSAAPRRVEAIPPVAASQGRIRDLSVEAGRPIYWLGPKQERTYELTRTTLDRIYVRYLPKGVAVGTTAARYPLVGTYPVHNAYDVLKELAKSDSEGSFTLPNGGFAVYSNSTPTNIYLAYPRSDVQIEVYDPSAARARELILSGQVVPVS